MYLKYSAFRNFQSAFAISAGLRSLPIFRLESVWRFIGRNSPKDFHDFQHLVHITNEEDNYANYRRIIAEQAEKGKSGNSGSGGGGGGGGNEVNGRPEVVFIAPLIFLAFYVGQRRRQQFTSSRFCSSSSNNNGDNSGNNDRIYSSIQNGDNVGVEDDWVSEVIANAVVQRVETEALEMETREKLGLLCLAETRQDARWACLLLRGWTRDKFKSFIPCMAVRASKMEIFVASQRPFGRGGRGAEEEEERSLRLANHVSAALDKFVQCSFGRLEADLLKAQCATLGYKFRGDARLRTKLLRSPCDRERDNLLISFFHEPVCDLRKMM